jgi:hypothetical protein
MQKRKERVQFSLDEKRLMIEEIKLHGSDEDLRSLTEKWNAQHESSRYIDIQHLKRLKKTIPQFSKPAEFWGTVEKQVNDEVKLPDALSKYKPPIGGLDYVGYQTKLLDAKKVGWISEEELNALMFDFKKYDKQDELTKKQKDNLQRTQKSHFRDHIYKRGMAYGPFSSFINPDEKEILKSKVGSMDIWIPSNQHGIWKTVGDVVQNNKFKEHYLKHGKATFSDDGKADDRINPNYMALKDYFAGKCKKAVKGALASVLVVCESLYRSVERLLPTEERADSRRRQFAVMPDLIPDSFSLLTCVSDKTKVQREHMDDTETGASALWGLVEDQYVIVWMNSYEMNLEIERIAEFYDFIVAMKPTDWSDEAFWNLVSTIHLRNKKFDSEMRPRPVKIPLKVLISWLSFCSPLLIKPPLSPQVGNLLLMDFLVVHSGMPFVEGSASLRGHLYWAQVAGRDGEKASDHTTFVWSTMHKLYPGWRFISEERKQFELDE